VVSNIFSRLTCANTCMTAQHHIITNGGLDPENWLNPATVYWSICTKTRQWAVMHLCHTIKTFTKYNRKIVETQTQSTHITNKHDRSLSSRCTVTSIKRPLTVLALHSHFNNMTVLIVWHKCMTAHCLVLVHILQ
jgi:hypothetical protein